LKFYFTKFHLNDLKMITSVILNQRKLNGMNAEMQVLFVAVVTIAFLHTLTGPDYYLPFIALSKFRNWSFRKTIGWTIFCGCGHVWSSVILGLGGAAIGWSLTRLKWLDSVRGGLAGWIMLVFGLAYGCWGFYKAYINKPHKHFDSFHDGNLYVYEHRHGKIVNINERHKVSPGVMFIIFLLGPCEPMIPLLFSPAAKGSWFGMLLLIVVYTFITLMSMLLMVVAGYYGLHLLKTEKLERYTHALGGLTLLICGTEMVFMAW
jgi:sulfite exporter TauE/SafE